jgi:hypothetical protein
LAPAKNVDLRGTAAIVPASADGVRPVRSSFEPN